MSNLDGIMNVEMVGVQRDLPMAFFFDENQFVQAGISFEEIGEVTLSGIARHP
ncbi:hypothetical protein HYU13_02165 [Candidatus Woesearchaeota archaeon]|nr:hypothetical protein [Candidatus Woesearchaeota archaeon]